MIKNNNEQPFVSVVVPTHNRRKFIPQLIRNYYNQTYPQNRMEMIIVDDGTDPIGDMVRGKPGIHYIHVEQRMSIGAKRNYLNSIAKGEIIVNMDDDDYYPPSRVSHAVEMLTKSDKQIAGSSEMFFYFIKEKIICKMGPFGFNHATAGTYAFKKEYTNKNSYDETVKHGEESKFTNRFSNPMIQLNSKEAILVIAHSTNTYRKRISKVLNLKLSDFIKDKKSLDFYLQPNPSPIQIEVKTSPQKRILISTSLVGGIGGLERNIYSTCEVLSDYKIDIYSPQIVRKGFFPNQPHVRVHNYRKGQQVMSGKQYDLYIQYRGMSVPYLANMFRVGKKVIIPGGNPVHKLESQFDYVLNQSPAGKKYLSNQSKHIMLTPPVIKMSKTIKEVTGLPPKYYFTLFNPYNLQRRYADGFKLTKGQDILYEICEQVKHPIVWGYSNLSFNYDRNIKKSSNLICKKDLTQAEISYLYSNAQGYLCFSREEGFGWSLADALLYDTPIYSRDIGILTSIENKSLFNIYNNSRELVDLLNKGEYKKPEYDKSVLSIEEFQKQIERLTH